MAGGGKTESSKTVIPAERITRAILLIRGQKVILDSDLAGLYCVQTKALNQAIRRNADRFPVDFVFRLTSKEKTEVVTNCDHLAYAFHLIYLWLQSADLAVQRVAGRVRHGGHDVPEAIIRRRYERSLDNFFSIYRPIADSWLMLDNSTAGMPSPIAWRNVGGPIQILNSELWERLRRGHEKDTS